MSKPEHVTSGCYLVWYRPDLPRDDVITYWRGPHGQIANKNRAIKEYLQHHFSATDHGFWPAPSMVGAAIPPDWRIDGVTEVRIGSLPGSLYARLFEMKTVVHDEQNLFERVLPKVCKPGGGLWWTGPYQPETGFRAVVFIRARHEKKGAPFRQFVESMLAPALMEAGARELRTHIFEAGGRFTLWTPEVRHDEPSNRCYAGALIIGTRDRAEFDRLMTSAELQATLPEQHDYCIAIHAYAVENTYPLTLDSEPQASV